MSLEIALALLESHHVRNCKEVGGYLNDYLKIIFARSPQLCNLYPRLTESGKHTSASMFDFMVKVGFCGQCFFVEILIFKEFLALGLIYNLGGATGRGRLESVHKGPREKGQPQHE